MAGGGAKDFREVRMKPEYAAHTPRDPQDPNSPWHGLKEHLYTVAKTAAQFASRFDAEEVAYWTGLLHDVGKFSQAFQRYLEQAHSAVRDGSAPPKRGSVFHAITGAILARSLKATITADASGLEMAFAIAAHHAGLSDMNDLQAKIQEKSEDPIFLDGATQALSWKPFDSLKPPHMPTFINHLEREFFVRMLLSCLVDADHLDTEAFCSPEKHQERQRQHEPLPKLLEKLKTAQEQKIRTATKNPVNAIRAEVYHNALEKALLPTGFFRLSVPTGGGKTRSSLAFALQHAIQHGLERVIYVVPYLTITQQIAKEFIEILGADNLIEHHSAVKFGGTAEEVEHHNWQKLASENWDANVVITTSVQFLESLFAKRPSSLRKLHRIAKSVIIFDEAQTLPATLLTPILEVLHQLTKRYGSSVVFCTATQPALDTRAGFPALGDREIAPDPARLFAVLERVDYQIDLSGWEIPTIAQKLVQHPQTLCVVNTRAQARAIFAELKKITPEDCLHLSTHLCGKHRMAQIERIKQKLAAKETVYVVSTQLIEAGVDLDFPAVYRALAPLDSLVQAAGRCNRNMLYPKGQVYIFKPIPFVLPDGVYKSATIKTENWLKRGVDLHSSQTFLDYFAQVYSSLVSTDAKKIQALRQEFNYAQVADAFAVIEPDTVSVLIRHYEPIEVANIFKPGFFRSTLRRLQPYLVSIYKSQLLEYQRRGLIRPCTEIPIPESGVPILYEWFGQYDAELGILEEVDLALTVY
jgi:CRISPR-associated endonuclease/helicase Cas3